MTCCTAIAAPAADFGAQGTRTEELRLAVRTDAAGIRSLRLSVPEMHCGGCIRAIESGLAALPGMLSARANLSSRSVAVAWQGSAMDAADVVAALKAAGFESRPLDDAADADAGSRESRDLLTRIAVAGFASANVMLLSVSIWSGAGDATRDLLHWVSALIALPTVIYAGRPFFVSALSGLRAGRLNMDAPISLAVILAAIISLAQVMKGGEEAYFDAAVMLLFLLLIGRWLDRTMRAKARRAAQGLASLVPRGAWVLGPEGARAYRESAALRPGDLVALDAGMRLPVDGIVIAGTGQVDAALVTGESLPRAVRPGDRLDAGVLALDASLTVRATNTGEDTTLAEIARLCAAAEDRKSHLARLADRAAAIYAPAVHLIALLTLIGWMLAGASAYDATLIAVAVLIVTCPCALGLAAPMAQAVAAGRLFREGVLLKDGAALERLATVDRAVFDKTGVLTSGEAVLTDTGGLSPERLARAAALAARSTHPLARALAAHAAPAPGAVTDLRETAGSGISGVLGGHAIRIGSAAFCGAEEAAEDDRLACWIVEEGTPPARLTFTDGLRPGAAQTVAGFAAAGVAAEMLSGDRPAAMARIARETGIADARAALRPEDKIARVEALTAAGHRVLMVGDGINDAPALAAATVSMAPGEASDIGRAAADIVFTRPSLTGVLDTWRLARRTRAVILQNFGLAAGYNLIAIPLAASGQAGPLAAAVAMSTSSLLVTLNALRLNSGAKT